MSTAADLPSPGGVLDHLTALRRALLNSAGAYVLLCVPAWFCTNVLLARLLAFAAPEGFSLHYFTLLEPFFVRLKIMLLVAAFAALPMWIWQAWQFIAPGLTARERRLLRTPAMLAYFLALAGAATALLCMVPAVVAFSLAFATPGMQPVIGIGAFVSLVLTLLLAGAAIFQFPLVIYALLTTGLVSPEGLRRKRPFVIVGILLLAALATPPDVISQLLLAIPAWALFELTLWIHQFQSRRPHETSSV